ncbi:MAG: glycosyltransferase [Chloroflexi bacterium]|nr:glycosyltransferase [Chloroflexota bacterium]
MAKLHEVDVQPMLMSRLRPAIGTDGIQHLRAVAQKAKGVLQDRSVINVNSTESGGGVAEMLHGLVAYARGVDIDVRWVVIEGTPEFFRITKRIHNGLHESPGDGGPLGDAERQVYEAVLDGNADELKAVIRPGDVVILHDPQTAGLVPELRRAGAIVIWRSHIGTDEQNNIAGRCWAFLRPYLEEAHAFVFSRDEYRPEWVPAERSVTIKPSIDPLSSKNVSMSDAQARAILAHVGLLRPTGRVGSPTYVRSDGTRSRVDRFADIIQTGPAPTPDIPLVVQVSRWDRLKDMVGVMHGFTNYLEGSEEAHLLLAGPVVSGVADDPEGGDVLNECIEQWRQLPHAMRRRVHLTCLPMNDREENAAIVNAIQRNAAVVVQKSLAEGFGLTVTEAMWKGCTIVASRVGAIPDQITDGEHGLLIDDATDLPAFGAALGRALQDPDLAKKLGENARERAASEFLANRHLEQYADLLAKLLS